MSEFTAEGKEYDVIVVGLGGHGSATLAYLAKNHPELNMLGIEQFDVTHKNGSSHGKSRIYRQAYFEDPVYVPLLKRSLDLWKELDEYYHSLPSAHSVFKPLNLCGGLMIGKPESEVIKGTLKSINTYDLPHTIYSAEEMKSRYPRFHLEADDMAIYEDNAGYLYPELCIETYVTLAKASSHHLDVHHGEKLISYNALVDSADGSETIEVLTSKGRYRTKKIILTIGAWAPEIYGGDLPWKLSLERRVLYWFEPTRPADLALEKSFQDLPIYIWDLGKSGNFYGFPMQAGYPGSVKVAEHHCHVTPSERCENSKVFASPATIDRVVHEEEVEKMRSIIAVHIPEMNGRLVSTETCMYTMTPNGHFFIDFHPKYPKKNVILASPCSGHGFKFCSVIGEILSDLAVKGETAHNIDLFKVDKFV